MCTRFVYNGNDTIVGFNFDIDLNVWDHKIIKEKDRFFIGIKMPDQQYHSFHGVNRNGNAATLLYVHGNKDAEFRDDNNCYTISDLMENYIKAQLTFDEAVNIVKTKRIVYAPDATMQGMLSDKNGRVLIVEPGIGYKEEQKRYSLITNYSLLQPASTHEFITPGDDRYERAKIMLEQASMDFSVEDAFTVLKCVKQDGKWATRVTFVYSVKGNKVYYVLNNMFDNVMEYQF